MGRAPCCEKDSVKRGPWTPEEDAKLLACVAQYGMGNWRTVPKKAGLQRCGKSCRLRWTNYLRPDLKHGRFTDQEEQTIVKLHAALGSRWSLIAAQLPGRTDNDVKNYWNTRLKRKLCEMGIDPITHKPISQLLADLAGSMAPLGCTTSTAGASVPSASRTITDAALGCFKDGMLNGIMRRRHSNTAADSTPDATAAGPFGVALPLHFLQLDRVETSPLVSGNTSMALHRENKLKSSISIMDMLIESKTAHLANMNSVITNTSPLMPLDQDDLLVKQQLFQPWQPLNMRGIGDNFEQEDRIMKLGAASAIDELCSSSTTATSSPASTSLIVLPYATNQREAGTWTTEQRLSNSVSRSSSFGSNMDDHGNRLVLQGAQCGAQGSSNDGLLWDLSDLIS